MAISSDEGQRGTLGTVRNATLLLNLLSTGPAHQPLTELAERSGLSLPTVHRLLRSLVLAGLVEQDPQSSRYGLGSEVVRLSEQYLARLPILRSLSPYLVELRNLTKATILVALLVRHEVVYVDRVDGEDVSGVFRIAHRVHPALDTAAGRILLARAPQQQWDEAVNLADSELAPADRLRWAEQPFHMVVPADPHDEAEIAVPVTDGRGLIVAALAATGSAGNFPEDVLVSRIAPQLQRAARTAMRTANDA